MLTKPDTALILHPPFQHADGFQWIAELPPDFAQPSDSLDAPAESRLRLSEDGRALGPPHALHASIVHEGGGRYSHWNGALRFSTSDGSNPNLNDRSYAVSIGPAPPKIVALGGCHLRVALAGPHARGMVHSVWPSAPTTGTPRETLQVLEYHLGRIEVPRPLRLWAVGTDLEAGALAACLAGADVAFVELGSSIDIVNGPFCLLHGALVERLITPVAALGRVAERTARQWLHKGLRGRNELLRSSLAETMRGLIPSAGIDVDVFTHAVANARGRMQTLEEMTETISRVVDALRAKATYIVSAHNAYTPDGRPLSWPENFPKQLEVACRTLGLPLFHPSRLVAEKGAAFSLQKDLHHFTPHFLDALGDELIMAASQVLGACPGEAFA